MLHEERCHITYEIVVAQRFRDLQIFAQEVPAGVANWDETFLAHEVLAMPTCAGSVNIFGATEHFFSPRSASHIALPFLTLRLQIRSSGSGCSEAVLVILSAEVVFPRSALVVEEKFAMRRAKTTHGYVSFLLRISELVHAFVRNVLTCTHVADQRFHFFFLKDLADVGQRSTIRGQAEYGTQLSFLCE